MDEERRDELGERVREQREALEHTLLELAERGTPMTMVEARLIAEISELRLAAIERTLAQLAQRPPPGPLHALLRPVRRIAARLRGLGQPKIGRLHHYPPRPLVVPRSYFAARAPDPAPPISLVTPSFQHARFIERTIRSVVDQGYPALEYVVQDGGSTDGTIEILETVGDRITRWVSEPDEGHADALNRGFRDTTGEIMGWLNSDDLLLPGSLAYVARYFAAHPEVDVVYGNRIMIDEHDAEVGAWILPAHDDVALTLADYVPQETLFWRRRVWTASGARLDDSFEYALDWDLLLRFRGARARMVRLPRFLGAFRVHEEQRTSASYQLGLAEMARLRERVYGRPVSLAEMNERLRPYLRRHVRAHLRQRLLDRVPAPRVRVQLGSRQSAVPALDTRTSADPASPAALSITERST